MSDIVQSREELARVKRLKWQLPDYILYCSCIWSYDDSTTLNGED